MTGQRVLHQAELRWQPEKDFSVIASSFGDQELARAWSARTARLARPAVPDQARGIPERSVAYLRFADGMAALFWRHYQRDAMPLYPRAARAPLVARLLIGQASVLTAGLAMALCHGRFAASLTPPPGHVPSGARLAPVDSVGVADDCRAAARDLDLLARQDPGLEVLIGTALRYPRSPLAVILPGPELTGPVSSSPALSLVWGLWRTTAPLLMPSASLRQPRGWSFSSYEPPLGNSETKDLPAIVFRSQEQERRERQPLSYRVEMTVRPRTEAAGGDHADAAGRVLVAAFRDSDSVRLRRFLAAIAAEWPGLPDRLTAISRVLSA